MAGPVFRKSFHASASRTARLALVLLVVLLLLLNAGGWIMLRLMLRSQERLLEQGVATSAALIAGAIAPENLFVLEASYDPVTKTTDFPVLSNYVQLPSADALQASVRYASAGGESFNVEILSPDGHVVLDRRSYFIEATKPSHADDDAGLIAEAAAGHAVASQRARGDQTKRAYHPLVSEDGTVIGVLRLESDATFGFPLRMQVRRLTIFALLSTVAILIMWLAMSRLIERAAIAERMAAQSDRLRALGTATAGIAHEIRNPLGIITLSVEELRAACMAIQDFDLRDSLLRAVDDLQGET
ncbi:hypothetical protein HZA57_09985, partial [Candidatus Poribacteria bacterium]|nr:hypothetical protein [Candidatus Poribacteria bacterium]